MGIHSPHSAQDSPIARLRARFAFLEPPALNQPGPTPSAPEPLAAPLLGPVDIRPTLAPSTLLAAGLAPVKAKIDRIRRKQFGGRLPDSLARVATIYSELAAEYLARGESVNGILDAIDLAAANAMALNNGFTS